MTRMILLAVALSWDSLIVGVVDGSLGISGASKLRMASLFALCDGTAVAAGLSFGVPGSLPGLISGAAMFASWLILILLVVDHLAWNSGRNHQWFVGLLPLLFCIDNLAAGPEFASLGAGPVASFGLAGAVSGLFFWWAALVAIVRQLSSRAWGWSARQPAAGFGRRSILPLLQG